MLIQETLEDSDDVEFRHLVEDQRLTEIVCASRINSKLCNSIFTIKQKLTHSIRQSANANDESLKSSSQSSHTSFISLPCSQLSSGSSLARII